MLQATVHLVPEKRFLKFLPYMGVAAISVSGQFERINFYSSILVVFI